MTAGDEECPAGTPAISKASEIRLPYRRRIPVHAAKPVLTRLPGPWHAICLKPRAVFRRRAEASDGRTH